MVIIEGPDGTGKTTLAKALCDKFDLEYRRPPMLSSSHGPEDDSILAWWDQQLRDPTLVVYDRCFYVSELVYQLATPQRPLMASGSRMMNGIRDLWGIEPFFVFCQTDWETQHRIISEQERDRHRDLDTFALQKISWAYDSIFAMWENALFENVRRYDFQISDHSAVEGLIGDYIERRQDAATA